MSQNTKQNSTVRELAREYVEASDAYAVAYRANAAAGLSIEARIDAQLACDAALKKAVAARMALDLAQAAALQVVA